MNGFPVFMVEHFYVKLGDPSYMGRKAQRPQRDCAVSKFVLFHDLWEL